MKSYTSVYHSIHINRVITCLLLATATIKLAAQSTNSSFQYKGKIGKTIDESIEWWPEKKKAPAGSPNVIVFLLDDAGFGTSSAFGGLMQTPTLDSLANNGLRYTNFHTTGVCSPTRAALLTGRNHHSVHMGHLNYNSLGFPGYDSEMPADKATIAEILKENNYNTYLVGKYHIAPLHEITSVGPFDRWPLGRGFDHFFGWHLGHTDQYHPNLYEDNQVTDIEPNTKHVTTLFADKAIKYISNQKSIRPDNPFFLYFSVGAIHSPHQVDQKWIEQYKGKFDKGWDWYREEVFARQKKLGVIPKNAILPDRDPTVPAWESLTPAARKLYARYMEVYAAFMTHTDYEFKRIIDFVKQIGQSENTVVMAIIGDNGSSRSSPHGNFNGHIRSLEQSAQVPEALKNLDKFGTAQSDMDAPAGWTQATNAPFRKWKTDANAEGGTRNPLIIYYPKRVKAGGIRNHYSHVIDIMPTIIDLANAKVPDTIKGHKQKPIEGTSLLYSLDDANAPDKHTVQYYELRGKRAIYKDGWKASVYHETGTDFDKDVWELYNLKEDFNERVNLAGKHPDKLKELQDLFDAEAIKYNVYPLVDGTKGRGTAGRERSAFGLADSIVLYPGVDQFLTMSGPQFKSESFTITADVDIASASDQGVLFAIGSEFEGLSIFIKDRKLQSAHTTGSNTVHLESGNLITPGKHELKFILEYKGPKDPITFPMLSTEGEKEGGHESLFIDNIKVAERKIKVKEARYVGFYKDGTDVGQDLNSPVSDRYKVPFKFTGKLNKVTIRYLQ